MSCVATMSPPDKISTIHAPLKLERMASASSQQTLSSKLRAMGFRKLPGPAAHHAKQVHIWRLTP